MLGWEEDGGRNITHYALCEGATDLGGFGVFTMNFRQHRPHFYSFQSKQTAGVQSQLSLRGKVSNASRGKTQKQGFGEAITELFGLEKTSRTIEPNL